MDARPRFPSKYQYFLLSFLQDSLDAKTTYSRDPISPKLLYRPRLRSLAIRTHVRSLHKALRFIRPPVSAYGREMPSRGTLLLEIAQVDVVVPTNRNCEAASSSVISIEDKLLKPHFRAVIATRLIVGVHFFQELVESEVELVAPEGFEIV